MLIIFVTIRELYGLVLLTIELQLSCKFGVFISNLQVFLDNYLHYHNSLI